MPTQASRRQWLKTTSALFAGMSIAPQLFAEERKIFKPGDIILLNSNENAYGPSPMARKAIIDLYTKSNRYPDDFIPPLKKKIAIHWKVSEENILLGAGSSEIIGLSALYVSGNKGHIITGNPAYQVWNRQAENFGLTIRPVSLNEKKVHDLEKMLGNINSETAMVYICNPNNPTGTVNNIDELRKFTLEAAKKTFVFIDEAYTEYAGLPSLADLAAGNKNILVAKTFSKIHGLAGARIGYAIAHPETIKSLSKFQPWPDADASLVSIVAASASLDDTAFIESCKANATKAREICYATFKDLKLEYIPSQTNFILFNIDKIGTEFSKKMQARNIFVQFRDHFGGKWCRVSMGIVEEMKAFSTALKEIV